MEELRDPICFEIATAHRTIAYVVYDENSGITALELSDAALIQAAPRLLSVLRSLSLTYTTIQVGTPQWVRAWEEADELLGDLKKAGVL